MKAGQAREVIVRLVLWLGLAVCLYAVWDARERIVDVAERIGLSGWIIVGLSMAVSWVLAVSAWRAYARAYTGLSMSLRSGLRQSGLLLVGKYVPGGVFGFLARLLDGPREQHGDLVVAGLSEQVVGLFTAVAMGLILYIGARMNEVGILAASCGVPFASLLIVACLHRALRFGWFRSVLRVERVPSPLALPLLFGVALQWMQCAIWSVLVVYLSSVVFGIDLLSAIGVAGAFGVAVGAGMLVVMAPGGIGVREGVLSFLALLWLSAGQAILLAAMMRLVTTLLDLLAGAVAFSLGNRRPLERGSL